MFTKRHTLHLSIQLILAPSCFLLIISPSYCKPNSFSQGILSYSVLLCGIYLHVTITWKIYSLFFFSILWPYYSGGFCFPPNIFKLGFVIIVYVCWTEELLFLPTLSIQRGGHCLIFSPQILTIKKVKNELNNSMNLNWKCLESCLELLFCSTQCTRHSHNQAA